MQEDNKCIHCGADCGKSPVIWNGMKFCCNGCKTVYQILNENKLYKYYDIENSPGIKIEQADVGNKYAYLDKEEVQEKIFEFAEGDIAKVNFFVPVIHCASCIWLLENLRTLHKGIRSSSVHFVKKEVSIIFNTTEISLRQLVEMLVSIHYVPEISLENKSDKEKEAKADKKLLYQMGLAGFVFANVMTYSLPEYFGYAVDGSLRNVFRILSYVLLVPMVFYSASDYFISAYKNLINRSINIDLPIALGISVLFIVTSYEVFSNTGSGYSDSLSGLIFFLLVGKNIQNKTYQALSFERDYKSYFPVAVTKINDRHEEESILLNEIRVADKILIRSKELIPADSILAEGEGLIDYSFVTGESTPVLKKTGDFIYAGGRQTGGIITIKVDKEVEQSHLTKLWNQNEQGDDDPKMLKSITDRISKYFTFIVISIAIMGFISWLLMGELQTAIFVFTAVLIVACPCALALSLPFTFGNTMRLFGKAGLYVKNISIIEKLTKIDTLVFDKTGTITKPNENEISFFGTELSAADKQAIYSLAKQSTHPLSHALSRYFADFDYFQPEQFVEMEGRGLFANVNGMNIRLGSKSFVQNDEVTDNQDFNSVKNSSVFVSINEKFKGYFSISNQYRHGFDELLLSLKQKFELHLLSGDNSNEKERLLAYFDADKMHFEQKPQDKKRFIQKLQRQNKTVLMTGDGLNDAGALMQSNVALSVADDVYHFSPAGDAVLEAAHFQKLADFIAFTKISLNIVKWSFAISFLYNIVGIAFALSGNLSPIVAAILMPISSISVVTFATFTTRIAGRNLASYKK